jgi:hypothetical protein
MDRGMLLPRGLVRTASAVDENFNQCFLHRRPAWAGALKRYTIGFVAGANSKPFGRLFSLREHAPQLDR